MTWLKFIITIKSYSVNTFYYNSDMEYWTWSHDVYCLILFAKWLNLSNMFAEESINYWKFHKAECFGDGEYSFSLLLLQLKC